MQGLENEISEEFNEERLQNIYSHTCEMEVDYLKEKYESKLIIAEQGGLWKADANTITILTALSNQFETTTVLIDTFDNPVEVDATALLETLTTTYMYNTT